MDSLSLILHLLMMTLIMLVAGDGKNGHAGDGGGDDDGQTVW